MHCLPSSALHSFPITTVKWALLFSTRLDTATCPERGRMTYWENRRVPSAMFAGIMRRLLIRWERCLIGQSDCSYHSRLRLRLRHWNGAWNKLSTFSLSGQNANNYDNNKDRETLYQGVCRRYEYIANTHRQHRWDGGQTDKRKESLSLSIFKHFEYH